MMNSKQQLHADDEDAVGSGRATVRGARNGTAAAAAPPATSRHYEPLLAKIRTRQARVGIIGLGYVGLPLAQAFANNGVRVLGFDVDPLKIGKLQWGESYIGHIPSDAVRAMRERGFEATDQFERLGEAD